MKDTVLTVRLPAATRRRLEALARREGRSLSAQVERLVEQGMTRAGEGDTRAARAGRARTLSGSLRGGLVPTLRDFREARALLSTSFRRRTRLDA